MPSAHAFRASLPRRTPAHEGCGSRTRENHTYGWCARVVRMARPAAPCAFVPSRSPLAPRSKANAAWLPRSPERRLHQPKFVPRPKLEPGTMRASSEKPRFISRPEVVPRGTTIHCHSASSKRDVLMRAIADALFHVEQVTFLEPEVREDGSSCMRVSRSTPEGRTPYPRVRACASLWVGTPSEAGQRR
jgi:hypothetical protein